MRVPARKWHVSILHTIRTKGVTLSGCRPFLWSMRYSFMSQPEYWSDRAGVRGLDAGIERLYRGQMFPSSVARGQVRGSDSEAQRSSPRC